MSLSPCWFQVENEAAENGNYAFGFLEEKMDHVPSFRLKDQVPTPPDTVDRGSTQVVPSGHIIEEPHELAEIPEIQTPARPSRLLMITGIWNSD